MKRDYSKENARRRAEGIKRRALILEGANGRCAHCERPTAFLRLKNTRYGRLNHILETTEKRFQRLKKYIEPCCPSCLKDKEIVARDLHNVRRYRTGCRCPICKLAYRAWASTELLKTTLSRIEKEVRETNAVQIQGETKCLPASMVQETTGNVFSGEILPTLWDPGKPDPITH